MSVKETAKAILAWNHAIEESVDTSEIGCILVCDEAVGGNATTWLLADLQAMANLWLLKDEIVTKLELIARLAPFPTEQDGRHLIAKIEALEDNDE